MACPPKTESPKAFKTPNKYKKSINQNKHHSMLPGTPDFFKCFLFIFERQSMSMSRGRDRERGRHRI